MDFFLSPQLLDNAATVLTLVVLEGLLSAVNAHWSNGNSAGTAFLGYALAYGVLSSLVVGYGLALFYKIGGLNLSTWVPFCWGLIQGVVSILRCVLEKFLLFEWAVDAPL